MNGVINAQDNIDECIGTKVTGTNLTTEPDKRGLDIKAHDTDALLEKLLEQYPSRAYPFAENLLVPINIERTLLTYTVANVLGADLLLAVASGDNIGKYRMKVNGTTRQLKRSYWSNFNVEFNPYRENLVNGDVVTITVENCGEAAETFEASMIIGIN